MTTVIAIANQKGGTGKTCTAIAFSAWLQKRDYSVVLIDADAQQSSGHWAKNLGIDVKSISDPYDLFEKIPLYDCDYTILDSPGSLSGTTQAILERSHFVLVPCQATGLDVHSTSQTVRMIRRVRASRDLLAVFMLSRAKAGTILLAESKAVLDGYAAEIPLLADMIHERQAIADSFGQQTTVFDMAGEGARKAAAEYETIFDSILEMIRAWQEHR
jgi:chromosome partitioning protein